MWAVGISQRHGFAGDIEFGGLSRIEWRLLKAIDNEVRSFPGVVADVADINPGIAARAGNRQLFPVLDFGAFQMDNSHRLPRA